MLRITDRSDPSVAGRAPASVPRCDHRPARQREKEGPYGVAPIAAAAQQCDHALRAIVGIESGFPVAPTSATNNTNLFTRTQRPNPTGADPMSEGDRESRIATQWLTVNGYTVPPAFTLGTGPRVDGRARGPHRNNVDLAVAKNMPLGGRVVGQFRLEVINLTNTVKVIGPIHTVGSVGFGQIRSQSGFMRMAQVMFRMTF